MDEKLNFEEHISGVILKEANKKLCALTRISKFMTQEKLKILLRSFIESQFNYCPLVWMFRSRTLLLLYFTLTDHLRRAQHTETCIPIAPDQSR